MINIISGHTSTGREEERERWREAKVRGRRGGRRLREEVGRRRGPP